MTVRAEIKCINKSDRDNAYERIKSIGGTNPDSGRWKMSQEKAVKGVDSGEYDFFVKKDGKVVEVITAESRFGNRYLKTEPDGEEPNNLLSLPECPA